MEAYWWLYRWMCQFSDRVSWFARSRRFPSFLPPSLSPSLPVFLPWSLLFSLTLSLSLFYFFLSLISLSHFHLRATHASCFSSACGTEQTKSRYHKVSSICRSYFPYGAYPPLFCARCDWNHLRYVSFSPNQPASKMRVKRFAIHEATFLYCRV